MTACPACADFAQNPQTGSYRAGCPECQARWIAQSQAYFNAATAKTMTESYKSALQHAFFDDWVAGHERVKHYAGLLKGST